MLLPYTEAVGFSNAIGQVVQFIESHEQLAKEITAKYGRKEAYAIGDGQGKEESDSWKGLI